MKKNLLIFLFVFLTSSIFSQTCDWINLINCGDYVNIESTTIDNNGNCYIAGKFEGEIEFKSSNPNDTIIKKYTSEHWHKTFIAKYNSSGKVLFVIEFKSLYGNSDLTYLQSINALNNGNLIVFLNCKDNFYIKDASGMRNTIKQNNKMFCFSSTGELKWSKRSPFKENECYYRTELDNGDFYIAKDNELALINSSIGDTLYTYKLPSQSTISSAIILGNELVLAYSSRNPQNINGFTINKGEVGILGLNIQTKKIHGYTTLKGVNCKLYRVYLSKINNKEFRIIYTYEYNASKEFDLFPNKSDTSKYNFFIVSYNQKGEYLNHLGYNTSNFNNHLQIGNNGDILINFTAPKNGCKFGNLIIDSCQFTTWVYDLVFAKLDKDLQIISAFKGGGTASNYHQSFLLEDKVGDLYAFSDLIEYGNLCNNLIVPEMHCSSYIMKYSGEK